MVNITERIIHLEKEILKPTKTDVIDRHEREVKSLQADAAWSREQISRILSGGFTASSASGGKFSMSVKVEVLLNIMVGTGYF